MVVHSKTSAVMHEDVYFFMTFHGLFLLCHLVIGL